MTFIEAIKKAYEKARDLKSKDNGNFSYYATARCGIYSVDIYDYGDVDADLYGCTVDDLTSNDWQVK